MGQQSKRSALTRRGFLQTSGLAMGAAALGPNLLPAMAAPANDRINVGVIGLGGRGRAVLNAFLALPDVRVIAVCDAWGERRQMGVEQVNRHYGNQDCDAHIDFMELLARPDIDALLIATGDNNHSLVSLMAARAGKDMYCEKPMSVVVAESRAVADTMKRLGRIFQCGTQRRSINNFRFAVDLARSGKLGRIKELHAEQSMGFQDIYNTVLPPEPEPAREEFDWSGWLGAAQWRPFNDKYRQRGYWGAHTDFAGGSITEWGSHTVDLCQWANKTDDTAPTRYYKDGDRYIGEYKGGAKIIIRTGLRFGTCPVRFEGEEGWVETGDSGEIDAHPKSLLKNEDYEGGYPPDNHVRAFIDAVRTRQETVSNAETAHRSISVCHVANICKRLGREIEYDPVKEICPGDEEATRLLSRAYREPWYL